MQKLSVNECLLKLSVLIKKLTNQKLQKHLEENPKAKEKLY